MDGPFLSVKVTMVSDELYSEMLKNVLSFN